MSPRRPPRPPSGWRGAAPAPECPREGAGVGIVERRGNLAHVVDWQGRDELAQLVTAFNEMASDLRAKAAEVKPSVTVVLPTPPLRELMLSTCTSNDDTFTTLKEPKS